jgi:predicted dehydrogenase
MMKDKAADGGRFERFCIVGLGGHARTKLIPAIAANGQTLAGVVTRQVSALPDAPAFHTVGEAVAALPADTTFVIATPPALHSDAAMTALAAGRDVFVEKPAFVTEAQARAATDTAAASGRVLVEAFMHRHSGLYRRLLADWMAQRGAAKRIDIAFLIPAAPAATFRQDTAIESSALYDIGCYALSLIADLGLPLEAIRIENVAFAGDPQREAVALSGTAEGVTVCARVGIGESYANEVSLTLRDGAIAYAPFFYGRPGEKTVTLRRGGETTQEPLTDGNAFAAMFATPRAHWLATQAERSAGTVAVTAALERLGRELDTIRKDNRG